MQTHRDDDAQTRADHQIQELEKRAAEMTERGLNRMTAGASGETPLREETHGNLTVRQLPDDPLAWRVSLGRLRGSDDAYLVFRGDIGRIRVLLSQASRVIDQWLASAPLSSGEADPVCPTDSVDRSLSRAGSEDGTRDCDH
jgi:hypothetical protein